MANLAKYSAQATRRTPHVILESGVIFIIGRSIPVNTGEFYRPVLEWIRNYVHSYRNPTKIEFGFEYINTSSTKWIFNIIKELSSANGLSEKTRIIWYYEQGDEDMCELGLILRSFVECPFHVVEVEKLKRNPYGPHELEKVA